VNSAADRIIALWTDGVEGQLFSSESLRAVLASASKHVRTGNAHGASAADHRKTTLPAAAKCIRCALCPSDAEVAVTIAEANSLSETFEFLGCQAHAAGAAVVALVLAMGEEHDGKDSRRTTHGQEVNNSSSSAPALDLSILFFRVLA
jgi:hypothetical protein